MQTEPHRLSEKAAALITDTHNTIMLSAASAWEISIKYALGRLPLPIAPDQYVPTRMARCGTTGLPVHHNHALHVATLPPHHRDPFDRLLIAQAQLEDALFVTADRQLAPYDVEVEWT